MTSCFFFLVNGYGLNGRGKQALDLYHRIPKDCISEITYICILNACSHSGLVDEAYQIFEPIPDKTSKIYATMVIEKKILCEISLWRDIFVCRLIV